MWSKLLAVGFGTVLLIGCGPAPDPNDLTGKTAPDFEVETLQSSAAKATLAQYKGKPVIIDFWATWCGPCRMLSPYVEKIYEDYKAKGLVGMAISDEARRDVAEFESKTPHKLPVYIDSHDLATGAYHVEGLPTVIIIDKHGNVVYDQAGFVGNQMQLTDASMRSAVEKAFGPS